MAHSFRFSASLGSTPTDEIVEVAKRAEACGFSSVTMPDHFDDQAAPLIGLTAVAMATTSLRVLPLVLANDYRHPVVLAKELATLDVLSRGRLEFGIGAGWMTTDYDFSGIEHSSPGARIARLSDSVDILTQLLRGEEVDHTGDNYNVRGSLAQPAPAQESGIPLLLAGGKQKMLTLAGAKADIVGINPGMTAGVIDERAGRDATLERTDQKLEWVRDGAGARFDDLEVQTRVHLAQIHDDRQALAAEMAPLLGMTTEEALASPHALVGTVQQCIDELRTWRERWGMSYITIDGSEIEAFAPVVEALAGT